MSKAQINRYKDINERIKLSKSMKKSLQRKCIKEKIKKGLQKYYENNPNAIKEFKKNRKGLLSWNNGVLQTISRECPGKGWVKGKLHNSIPKNWK